MNRYILTPDDTLRVLPPEADADAAIEIFCARTVIYFALAQLRSVCLMHGVPVQTGTADALCVMAKDRLLGQEHMVLIPADRPDYPAFLEQLKRFAPQTLDLLRQAEYVPERCDHNGHHDG